MVQIPVFDDDQFKEILSYSKILNYIE